MKRKIDPVRFVRAWITFGTVGEVAAELQMSAAHATQYAKQLRDKGVELPKKHSRLAIDVTALNELIKKEG